MPKEKTSAENLNDNLKQLSDITEWFDNQEEIDVEEGLKKVKEAVALIKTSKSRLKAIENEFDEIKTSLGENFVSSSDSEIKKEIDIEEDES